MDRAWRFGETNPELVEEAFTTNNGKHSRSDAADADDTMSNMLCTVIAGQVTRLASASTSALHTSRQEAWEGG